jgi:hypothetical protein
MARFWRSRKRVRLAHLATVQELQGDLVEVLGAAEDLRQELRERHAEMSGAEALSVAALLGEALSDFFNRVDAVGRAPAASAASTVDHARASASQQMREKHQIAQTCHRLRAENGELEAALETAADDAARWWNDAKDAERQRDALLDAIAEHRAWEERSAEGVLDSEFEDHLAQGRRIYQRAAEVRRDADA